MYQSEQQKIPLPKVGQFVRVKRRDSFKFDHQKEWNYYDLIVAEGLVSSTLFDKNFEVSYIYDDKPESRWFSLDDVFEVEVL